MVHLQQSALCPAQSLGIGKLAVDRSRTEHSRVISVETAAIDVTNDLIEIGQGVCLIFVLDDLYHGLSSANQLAKEICPLSIKSASAFYRKREFILSLLLKAKKSGDCPTG